ncbi:MAG TPA: DUF1573 domain-containing protein [Gemmataceae bacterium]|nr:DUF1573 domain-containing protein [Gemmataceae bacterium]
MSRTLPLRPATRRAAVVAVALTAAVALAAPARAGLMFSQPRANVGPVRTGTQLSHEFAFTNPGPDEVEVVELRASCGCMKPRLEPKNYPPGSQGKVRVEINTLTVAPGPHAWRVEVFYRSGGKLYDVPLLLTGFLITEVTVQPGSLTLFADGGVAHALFVTDLRDKPLAVKEVRATSPKLRPRVAEAYRDPLGHLVRKISLEVAPDFPEGKHEETLDILTDDPDYRDLRVPVTVFKRSKQQVTAVPPAVSVTAPAGQPVPSRIIRLRDNDNQPVVVEGVTSDHPAVSCQWAGGPGNSATLRVTVDRARVPGGTLRANVRVQTAAPARETITIPVTCTLQ